MGNWIYQNKEVTSYEQIEKILGYSPVAFIYCISLNTPDGLCVYYGQKTMKTDNKRIIGKRELKERGKKPFRKYKSKKGKKKGTWIYFEEGKSETWQDYNSSSDLVKELIADGVPHQKEILEFTTQKGLLNYLEIKQIICTDCLENVNCLNLRAGNHHSRHIIKSLEKDKKIKNGR